MSSVYQSLKPICTVSRLFGVMPVKLKVGSKDGRPVSRLSHIDYVYSVVLFVFTVVHAVSVPIYVVHTSMPVAHKDSLFVFELPEVPEPTPKTVDSFDEVNVSNQLSFSMKILSPFMVSISSTCCRLTALMAVHRGFGTFVDVMHNMDQMMGAGTDDGALGMTNAIHLPEPNRAVSLLYLFDKFLL